MSERAARVRLMLNTASFLGGLQQTTQQVTAAGQKWASALKEPTAQALSRTRESLKESVGQAKSLASAALGIAGGFSVAAGAAGAASLEDRYRVLAFAIEQATGEATKWQDVQRMVEPAADAVNRTSQEMIGAFDTLREKSGDVKYSAQALSVVGEAMNATGRSGEELGAIVGTLHKKWGISDMGQVKTALMQVFEVTKGGKIRFEELAEDLDELGSIAGAAGMGGVDGFRKALGLAAAIAPNVNQSISEVLTGMDQLTEKMRQMPVVQGLAESGKFAGKKFFDEFTSQPDAMSRVRMMLEKSAKRGALGAFMRTATEEEFTGREERAAFKSLADPFKEAFDQARASGDSAEVATSKAVAAFDANIAKLGQTTGKWDSIQQRAADNQQAVSAKIRQAQEMFQRAFTDPQTIGAMGELAKDLPRLASGIARLVGLTVNHPLLAGATLVGGRAALSGASSLVSGGASAMWGSVAEKFTDAVNRKKTVTRALYDEAGARVGMQTVEVRGSKLANVAKIAGQALGVAAAAVMAYELGKMAIDSLMGDDLSRRNKAENVTATGMAIAATGDRAGQQKALEAARAQQKELEKGPGILESIFGGIANVATGGEIKSAGEMNENAKARNLRVIADLEEALGGGAKAGQSLDRMALAADKVVRAFDKFAAPATSGSNGLPPPAKGTPGFWE